MPDVLLPVPHIDLAATLLSGQVFRWKQIQSAWIGTIGTAAFKLEAVDESLRITTIGHDDPSAALQRFFRLDVDLASLAAACATQPELAGAVGRFAGLRVVRQPAWDALLSFACSSANSIPRINRSLHALAQNYGTRIGEIDGEVLFSLPTPDRLAVVDATELWRVADLGYRGRVIQQLAAAITDRSPSWLADLEEASYADAHAVLASLPGIGPKIADCVCLYGLGHDEAIPVDSHIWAIARDLFGDSIPTASLTIRTYNTVANLYRMAFSVRPGWAQHYLFHQRRQTPVAERRKRAA